jgi:hypothetical protein
MTTRASHLLSGPALAVAAAIVALTVRFFMVISKYSVNIFFYDQWDFLTPFFRHQAGIAELFFLEPAGGPEREGLGLMADKFLYPITHWNARVDSFLIGGIIVVAMLLALQLKRKLFGAIAYSDIAIPVIFLTLVQFETLIGTPNAAHAALPLLLTMLYCLALLGHRWLLRYSLILGLNFLLVFTGFGIFMGGVTVGVFLLECYWSWRRMTSVPFGQALAGLIVAAASLASFFIHYTFSSGVDCFALPHSHLLEYPEFMALIFSAFVVPRPLHVTTGTVALGVAIVLAVLAILCWHLWRLVTDASAVGHLIGTVLLSFCLLFTANAAVGRACLGMQAAFAPRYSTLMIPAFLALYFYVLSQSWYGKRNLILALLVLLLLPACVHEQRYDIRWYSDGKRAWADCYRRTENIKYCDQTNYLSVYPAPHPPDLQLKDKLDYLKQHHLNLFDETAAK